MTTSILENKYIEPERPYSQRELEYIRSNNFRSLRVGNVRAHHKKCDHFYYVKENGRKEKEMKEQKRSDVGNCSVCWKFNKTPRHLKKYARDLIDEYCHTFFDEPKILSYRKVDTETIFYKWLYE